MHSHRHRVPILSARPQRRVSTGFTLTEVMVASLVSTIVLASAAGIWQSFGRSLVVTAAEARLSSNARMALETLRMDLGGSLPESNTGDLGEGQIVGRLVINDQLRLCYDMPPLNASPDWTLPDRVVTYELIDGQLLRTLDNGDPFMVANFVTRFQCQRNAATTEIEIEFEDRGQSRTITLTAQDQ